MAERYRNYVVRKYISARNAAEAIELERGYPVSEVNETGDKPDVQNNKLDSVIGFHTVRVDG